MGSSVKRAFQDPVGRLAGKAFGKKTFSSIDLGGQVLGQYDNLYKPGDVETPSSPIVDDQAYLARERFRRLARRAQGQQSTIRTGLAVPYSGQPKSLLGS